MSQASTANTKELDYVNIAFFAVTPFLTLIAAFLYLHVFHQHIQEKTMVLTFVMYCLGGFSISMGYHRLFSHRSYETNTVLKALLLFFGAGTFEQSALRWSQYHRDHHAYTDTEKDPHNIAKGFFFAHIGWVFYKADTDFMNAKNITDLHKDKWVMFQEKHYMTIAILSGWILPIAIASLWGDPFGGLIFAAAARIVLFNQATFCINSLTHMFGSRPYNKTISARDNFWMSLITFGEGFHNYHHAYPYDYRNGRKFWNFDPSKWTLFVFSKVRVVKNLRRADHTTASAPTPKAFVTPKVPTAAEEMA